jgi:hypothetical protein
MQFRKIGVLWQAGKKDKNGMSYMNGMVSEDTEIRKGEKLFVFQNVGKRSAKSPVATIVLGREEDIAPIVEVEDTGVPADEGPSESAEPIEDEDAPF